MDSSAWDARYGESKLVWSEGPNQFLPPVVADLRPGSALDIASGEGRNAIWLAEHHWKVTAVDFSSVGVEKGRDLAEDLEIEWVVADVVTFEPNGHFDLVLVFYLHLPQDQFAKVLQMAARAVAPGGTVFCVGHAVRNVDDGHGGPQVPAILWSEIDFEPLLQSFEAVELGERFRNVEGAARPAIDLVFHGVRPNA